MNLSDYYYSLDDIHQSRYVDKISAINEDPYLVKLEDCSTKVENFPKILYPDIVTYLLDTKSAYTKQELKAYKSLEGYNQAVCGWVKRIGVKRYGNNVLVLGKVMHSQRLNEKLLSPWIIAHKDGNILSAHCDCVAGLGEVCSHVSALLFLIDEQVRQLEVVTRTGEKAYWMPPTNKPAEPKTIFELDLRSAKRKYIEEEENVLNVRDHRKTHIKSMSGDERIQFLKTLRDTTEAGCSAHLVTAPFAYEIHEQLQEKAKYSLTLSLFKEEYTTKSLEELQQIGAQLDLTLSVDVCKKIENETKAQAKCKSWFLYRAGRVTASKFKRCCRTSINKPSVSLIRSICYPQTYKGKVRALEYGCKHEKEALRDFANAMKKNHSNFEIEDIGFFINPKYPYFGASPDAIVECDCCGMGIIEIKCPYCARHSGILDQLEDNKFFIKTVNGELQIKEDHAYFYQIQMQLAITGNKYGYLVAWSKQNHIFVKVSLNEEFWERESLLAKNFFFQVLLPEILGKFYTREKDNEEGEELQIIDTEAELTFEDAEIDLYEEVVAN